MSTPGSSAEIERTAAEWLVKIDRRSLTASEQEAFEQWLGESLLHQGAFAKAEAIVALIDDERADAFPAHLAARLSPAYLPHGSTARHAPFLTRRNTFWFAAGALAVSGLFEMDRVSTMGATIYKTQRGEVRSIPLQDGSTLTLNTSSEVSIRLRKTVREITVARGEVLFDVAKDRARPFVVTAGNTVVRAVGTSFLVRDLQDQPLVVLVREGAVDVFRREDVVAPLRVSAASEAVALDVPTPTVRISRTRIPASEIERELAWCTGMISFEDETLKSAAEKFARYSTTRIVIDDPGVANETVTGLFSMHDPEGFARSAALSLNLHVAVASGRVMLWR